MADGLLKKHKGFTLIEVIATMLILGIVAAFAGYGIVNGIQSYMFTVEKTEIAQETRLAMYRIISELRDINTLVSATTDSIRYESTQRGSGVQFTIRYNAASSYKPVEIVDGRSGTAYTLMENVNGLTFKYTDSDGVEKNSFNTSNPLTQLRSIKITVQVPISDGNDLTFQTEINPRNNGLSNAPVPN